MPVITPWMIAGQLLGIAAYSLAWFRGGHPERFAAGVLLFGYLISSITFRWTIGGLHVASAVEEIVLMSIFIWLAVRSSRWWPTVTAAVFVLIVLANIAPLITPGLPSRAVASAQIGLWLLVDLSVLLSVGERKLAGERPVSPGRFAEARGRRGRLASDFLLPLREKVAADG